MAKTEVLNNDVATVRVNAEPLEAVVDTVKEVVEVTKNNKPLLVAVGVGGLVIGGVAGYKFCQKRLTTKYDLILKTEEVVNG